MVRRKYNKIVTARIMEFLSKGRNCSSRALAARSKRAIGFSISRSYISKLRRRMPSTSKIRNPRGTVSPLSFHKVNTACTKERHFLRNYDEKETVFLLGAYRLRGGSHHSALQIIWVLCISHQAISMFDISICVRPCDLTSQCEHLVMGLARKHEGAYWYVIQAHVQSALRRLRSQAISTNGPLLRHPELALGFWKVGTQFRKQWLMHWIKRNRSLHPVGMEQALRAKFVSWF